jgi:hypothetical protein
MPDDRLLQIKGFVVDTVKRLSDISSVRDHSKRETYEMLKQWPPPNPGNPYLASNSNSETIEDAFLRTITADSIDASNNVLPIRPHKFDWTAVRSEKSCFDNQELSIYATDIIESMRKAIYRRRFM